MKYKNLLVIFILMIGLNNLYSQTIKINTPCNSILKTYTQNSFGISNKVQNTFGTKSTPAFIKYKLNKLQLDSSPGELCIPPDSNIVFCTLPEEKILIAIDMSSGSIIDTIKFAYRPSKMIMNKKGNMIYVAANNWSAASVSAGLIYAVNTSDYKIVNEIFPNATTQIPIDTVGVFDDIILNESQSLMYVIDDKWIHVMDLIQNKLIDIIYLPQTNNSLNVLTLNNERLFCFGEVIGYPFCTVNLNTKETKIINPSGNYSYSVLSSPVLSPDGNKVFINAYNNGRVAGIEVYNSTTSDFIEFVPNLTTLGGVLSAKDTTKAYLNEGEWPSLKTDIINLSTFSKIGEINGGGYSGATSKDKKYLYYSKYGTSFNAGVNSGIAYIPALTVIDADLDYSFSIDISNDRTNSFTHSSIACTEDNKFIAMTNPDQNSIAIISDLQELVPNTVSLVLPKDSSNLIAENMNFNWSIIPDITYYHIQISTDTNFTNLIVNDSLVTSNSKQLISLSEGAKYYWRVAAKNVIGVGPYSEVRSFSTLLNAPGNLAATALWGYKVSLSWSDASKNESGYIIERALAKDTIYALVDTVKSNVLSYTDSSLTSVNTYDYRVKAYNALGSSVYSNVATVSTITAVENKYSGIPTRYEVMQNYPNPFNPTTVIEYGLPAQSQVKIVVYNILGAVVKDLTNTVQSAGYHNVNFGSDNISSGVYFYKIEAKSLDGSKQFREIKKMMLIK